MPTEQQLVQALRKADEAGNTQDAQRLADMIRQQRQQTAQQAQPVPQGNRPIGEQAARGVGLLARNVAQGGAGLLGIVADPLDQAAGAVLGYESMPMREQASRLADMAGLPQAETAGERVGGNIVELGAGGGGFIGIGRNLAQRGTNAVQQGVGRLMQEAPRMQLASAAGAGLAGGVAQEAGAGEGAQVAATLAGGLTPVGLRYAGEASVRGLARGGDAGRQAMQTNIDEFSRAGVDPTLGQASGTSQARLAEAIVRNAPGGSGRMATTLRGQADDMSQRVNQIADSLSPAEGAERGGRAIVSGVTGPGGFLHRFRQKSGELYDIVEGMLPSGTQVQATNSQRVLSELTTPIAGAEQTSLRMMNPRLSGIAESFGQDVAAGNGAMPYAAIKQLRTQVGELIGDSALSPDMPTRQLRALYGALSEDMAAAARATGDPSVIQAASRANSYYRAGMNRVEEIERVVERSGGPEAVFKSLFSGSREGGTTIRRLMQSLDEQGQKDVAAVTVRRLGRANPGKQDDIGEVFSPETFLTNWNTMSPSAKGAMFSRLGPKFNRDMDAIAAASARMREAASTLPNPSGTAGLGAQATAYGLLGASVFTGNVAGISAVAGSMAASRAFAEAFSNPRFVRWLARQTELPANTLPNQIRLLQAEAASTKDEGLQAAAETITEAMQAQRRQGPQQIAPAGQ